MPFGDFEPRKEYVLTDASSNAPGLKTITLEVLKQETSDWKSAWSPRCVELLEWAAGTIERREATYRKPKEGWICFHCGERFLTYDEAKAHFGETPDALTRCVEMVDAMKAFTTRMEGAALSAPAEQGNADVCNGYSGFGKPPCGLPRDARVHDGTGRTMAHHPFIPKPVAPSSAPTEEQMTKAAVKRYADGHLGADRTLYEAAFIDGATWALSQRGEGKAKRSDRDKLADFPATWESEANGLPIGIESDYRAGFVDASAKCARELRSALKAGSL
jgi:hypothetical protein